MSNQIVVRRLLRKFGVGRGAHDVFLWQKTAILTTIGVLEEPLGNARLHGSRLIAALLHTNTPSINQELCRLSTMDLLLVSDTGGRGTGEGSGSNGDVSAFPPICSGQGRCSMCARI